MCNSKEKDWFAMNKIRNRNTYRNTNKNKSLTRMRRVITLCLAAILVVTLVPCTAGAASTSQKADASQTAGASSSAKRSVPTATTISGVALKHNPSSSGKLTDRVKVTPAGDRKLSLQLYSKKKRKWITTRRFAIPAKGKVKVTFPKQYKKKTRTKWRLTVPSTANATGAKSRTIKVTTRNVKKISLRARTACIYCATDKVVLYDKKMNQRRSIASTTKLMTAMVLIDGKTTSGKARVSASSANTPYAKLFARKGDYYKVKDLFKALLIPSSNDAANILAEKNAHSKKRFAKKMNRKTRKLGLKRTKFVNAHGLEGRKYNRSTALEMSKIMAAAYKYKLIRKIIRKKSCHFRSLKYKKSHSLKSTDKLLGFSRHFKGGKTGTEDKAGKCFTGVFKYKGKVYVVTILGSTPERRWKDVKKMWHYIKKYGNSSY